jgi:transcription termination/antitermination protein NusA
MNPSSDLSRVIEAVEKDRGIKKEIIVEALEQAVLMAAQKKLGPTAVLEAHYNDETGEIEVFQFKKVMEDDLEDLDHAEEIHLQEALKLDPEAQIGDELGIRVETDFGRIDAQTAKQVIFQKVRDAEREIIYNEYIHRKDEVITGIARRAERGNLVIDLGKTDALLPRNQIIPGETFRPGDRVQAYLDDVVLSNRGPQIFLSRSSPNYLKKLFEMEVPEIQEGIVEIKTCAREPGRRSKIAVISNDSDVDPVGACVGMKGVRVQNVIQELRGEKIDIIPWSENPAIFVQSALAPAEISSVRIDENQRTMEIMVDDDQLSLAIGRRGQNVRLAAQLTGWRLDIVSKSKLQKKTQEAIFNLQHITGVGETLAHSIYQAGFASIRQVAEASIEDLQRTPGYEDATMAAQLKESAKTVVEQVGDVLAGASAAPISEKSEFSVQPGITRDAKTLAEERLKQMMQEAGENDSPTSHSENEPSQDSQPGDHD